MNCLIDESEIKIEYYESVEEDPLRNINKITSDNDEHSLCVENTKSMVYNSVPSSLEYEKANNETWYKKIDDSGKYLCRFCHLSYSTVQTLRHHTKVKHPDNADILKESIVNNKRSKKIKCHICNKKFKDIKILQDHINLHFREGLGNYCHICKARFENDVIMKGHLFNKHNIAKSTNLYLCNTCGYQTLKKSHLNQHKQTHYFKKLFKCKICKYSTSYMPNLKMHEKIHSQSKPYVCEYKECEYAACTKSALQSHLLKHNPEKNMLYCDRCTYKTVYGQSLKKHIEGHIRNTVKLKS